MTDQTNAALEAAEQRAEAWKRLCESTETALTEVIEERDEARMAAEDHVLDADAVHVRLSAELREIRRERDNWKMSAEEAERAEKRWKDRAVEAERELQVAEDQANNLAGDLAQAEQRAEEAERLAEVRRETIREYERENESWSVRVHTAERQARAAEAEAEHLHLEDTREIVALTQERNQLAAVVEKVRAEVAGESVEFRHRAGRVLDILATSPAEALREVKAEAWQEGAYRVYNSTLDEAEWRWSDWASENPYKAREEQA